MHVICVCMRTNIEHFLVLRTNENQFLESTSGSPSNPMDVYFHFEENYTSKLTPTQYFKKYIF